MFTEVHPHILRYCRGRLGDQLVGTVSAEAIAHDVCEAAIGMLPNFPATGLPFRAFVYGIAAHHIVNAYRVSAHDRNTPTGRSPGRPRGRVEPDATARAADVMARLDSNLRQLSPRQREVLILRIAVGLTAEETARLVGSTPGAVRLTQARALSHLRTTIPQTDTEGTLTSARPSTTSIDPQDAFDRFADDLTTSVLDLPAGLDDATRSSTYTALADDMNDVVNLEAGLNAIVDIPANPEP